MGYQPFIGQVHSKKRMKCSIGLVIFCLVIVISQCEARVVSTQERFGIFDKIKDLVEKFEEFDAYEDGSVSLAEIKEGILGMFPKPQIPETVQNFLNEHLKQFDSDGDGNISLKEIIGKAPSSTDLMDKIKNMMQ